MILNITIFTFFAFLALFILIFLGGCSRDRESRQTGDAILKQQITSVQDSPVSSEMEVELKKSIQHYNDLGRKLVKESKFDEAMQAFRQAYEIPVSDEDGLKEIPQAKLLEAIEKFSNPKDALTWVDSNLTENLDKQEDFIITNIGSMFLMCEDYQKAIEVMEKGVSLHPDSIKLHYRAISSYILNIENRKLTGKEKENSLKKAVEHLKALRTITGERHQLYFLAKAYTEIAQGDSDSAIQSFNNALNPSNEAGDDRTSMNIDANYYLGLLLIEKGEYEKAAKHLNAAFALYDELDRDSQERFNPVRVSIILLREMYCNQTAKTDSFDGILKDRKFLEEIAGVYHEPRSIKLTEAAYQFVATREKGNKKEALRQLKRLNNILVLDATCEPYHRLISPRNISAFHTFRGDIFAGEGDIEKARSEYEKALEYTPNDKTTLARIKKV